MGLSFERTWGYLICRGWYCVAVLAEQDPVSQPLSDYYRLSGEELILLCLINVLVLGELIICMSV